MILRQKIPIVIVERSGCYGLHRVLVDTAQGIFLATEYLINMGHRDLIYLTPNPIGDVERERMSGFINAVTTANLGDANKMIHICNGWNMDDAIDGVKRALEINPQTTAIVAWSDSYAAGVMRYLLEIGKSIPGDISVIGNDDVYAAYLAPELTTVHMPVEEMAICAIDLICNSAETAGTARTVTLSPFIVERGSCAPPVNT